MYELIDYPSFGWICKLNEKRRFSGSLGTGSAGAFAVNTFHYQLWKKEVKDEEENVTKYLAVRCFVHPPVSSGQECFAEEETVFELSPEGAQQAKEWILQQACACDLIGTTGEKA